MYRRRDGREQEFEEVGRDVSYLANQQSISLTPTLNHILNLSRLTYDIMFGLNWVSGQWDPLMWKLFCFNPVINSKSWDYSWFFSVSSLIKPPQKRILTLYLIKYEVVYVYNEKKTLGSIFTLFLPYLIMSDKLGYSLW